MPVCNPANVFSKLSAHMTGITAVGTQAIDGVETKTYQDVELVQGHHLRVTISVDKTGLVRKLIVGTCYPAATTGTGALPTGTITETITARFFRFGVQAEIEPPSQVTAPQPG